MWGGPPITIINHSFQIPSEFTSYCPCFQHFLCNSKIFQMQRTIYLTVFKMFFEVPKCCFKWIHNVQFRVGMYTFLCAVPKCCFIYIFLKQNLASPCSNLFVAPKGCFKGIQSFPPQVVSSPRCFPHTTVSSRMFPPLYIYNKKGSWDRYMERCYDEGGIFFICMFWYSIFCYI